MQARSNPGRQLNVEETRVYACGMAAARRGELQPKEQLSSEFYYLWKMGWSRVGKRVSQDRSVCRSVDPEASVNTCHMVRTEVQTLDDALKIIDRRQRQEKAAETLRSAPIERTWKQELSFHNGVRNMRKKTDTNLIAQRAERISDLEARQVAYVSEAIRILSAAVRETSSLAAMHRFYPAVNPATLIDVIGKLSRMIKQNSPLLAVERKPVEHSRRLLCVVCGGELMKGEVEYCFSCRPENRAAKIASDLHREHHEHLRGLESDARQLSKLINKIKRGVIEHEPD
jgi:hypothetical protein